MRRMSQDAPLHVDPQLSVPAPEPQRPAPSRLFTPGQILAAGLLGSVLAGAFLFASNERRLGRPRIAWLSVALASAVVAVVLALSFVLEGDQHHFGFLGHALGFGLWEIAKRQQGAEVKVHLDAGVPRGSTGAVILSIVGTALAILAAAGAGFVFARPYGKQLRFGASSVYYVKGVTVETAQKIGDALSRDGFFGDSASDLQVRREGDGYLLVMVAKWPQPTPDQLRIFQSISQQVADAVAPMPIELALADDEFTIKTRVTRLPREKIDAVSVYLIDGATPAEAHRLVDTLVQAQLIKLDEPHRYELRRDGEGYVVSVTLKDGAWDQAKVIDAYKEIGAAVSKGFGGKRVRYRLCDGDFSVKKTVP
jgi:hypothetical protein